MRFLVFPKTPGAPCWSCKHVTTLTSIFFLFMVFSIPGSPTSSMFRCSHDAIILPSIVVEDAQRRPGPGDGSRRADQTLHDVLSTLGIAERVATNEPTQICLVQRLWYIITKRDHSSRHGISQTRSPKDTRVWREWCTREKGGAPELRNRDAKICVEKVEKDHLITSQGTSCGRNPRT